MAEKKGKAAVDALADEAVSEHRAGLTVNLRDQAQAHTGDTCPNCGYCPHCGRSRQQAAPWYPYVPYAPPVWPQTPLPWVISGPRITWSTGSNTYTVPNTPTFTLS